MLGHYPPVLILQDKAPDNQGQPYALAPAEVIQAHPPKPTYPASSSLFLPHPDGTGCPLPLGTMSHKLFCNGDCLLICRCCYLVTKLCPILCDPMDCSPPGSSAHGICQARILEWVAISFCRGSSHSRDQICVSCLAGLFLITEPPGKLIS